MCSCSYLLVHKINTQTSVLKYLDVKRSQVKTSVNAHCISVSVCPKMKWNTITLICYLGMDMLYKGEVILRSDNSNTLCSLSRILRAQI